jgi:hypothetical protein
MSLTAVPVMYWFPVLFERIRDHPLSSHSITCALQDKYVTFLSRPRNLEQNKKNQKEE